MVTVAVCDDDASIRRLIIEALRRADHDVMMARNGREGAVGGDVHAIPMLNKVPEVTLVFWIIKVMSTTVGETAADFLSSNLGLGLSMTSLLMSGLLVSALVVQFQVCKYVPTIYWLGVVLISIVGTLITDNLTDNLGITLQVTTTVFTIALMATFAAWYSKERTLSIHTIVTTRRESFYWLAILVTFALGTAAGDLLSELLSLGYTVAGLIFGGAIAVVAAAHYGFGLNAVLSFWLVYILTRPLGASLGDLLSQPKDAGGLGLGTTGTSAVFLVVIVIVIAYFTAQEKKLRSLEEWPVAERELDSDLVYIQAHIR